MSAVDSTGIEQEKSDIMTGIINWNELWKMTRSDSRSRKAQEEDADMERAKWFNDALKAHKERTEKQIAAIELDPDYTVLDVGAGTGRLAIPLAKEVKAVTAVDPSKSMLTCLRENMEKEDVTNTVCINKRWEDIKLGVDIVPHDVVIASHSLAMLDIQEAVAKIDAAAKRSVYLFTFVTGLRGLMWMNDGLWKEICGERHQTWSDYIYLCNILHDMGIYANVKIWDSEFEQPYGNLDELVDYWKEVYNTPPEKEAILKEHLSRMLVEKGGSLYLKGKSKSAVVWWTKDEHKG